MSQQKIMGIDLGTTNSCVSVVEGGRPIVIPNAEGGRTTPSVVSFDQDGNRIVGTAAKRQAVKNPDKTILSIKRHMGTDYRLQIDHRSFSPEQISAVILQKLKQQAQNYLGEKISKAIITVPAYYDDSQRLATRNAGQIAGLDVVRIINEPTASALAYGLNKLNQESNIVIFDFGGGTFDVTLLQFAEQVLQVRATNGNNRLGGDDFDQRIIDWIHTKFAEINNTKLDQGQATLQRLKEAAEKAKFDLSTVTTTSIELPFISYSGGDPLHFSHDLTRAEFDRITQDLVKSCAVPIETALSDAKIRAEQIDYVVLVGGSTRIPAVQQFIRGYFQKEPAKSVNPDEAVAIGAAIQGGILTGEIQSVLLLDVIPMSFGVEEAGGRFSKIIEKNTTIPVSRKKVFTTGIDGQKALEVHVVQGENDLARHNVSLAKVTASGIPPGPAGSSQIELTFDIDVDGVFFCSARELSSGTALEIELRRTTGFSRGQLEQLASEEAKQAEEDEKAFFRRAAKTLAESAIVGAERALAEHGGVLPSDKRDSYQAKLTNMKQQLATMSTEDLERVKANMEVFVAKLAGASPAQA